jgi:hypothetical protein
LKQTEVIGSRGRNWPVFDGKDQIRLINSGVSEAPTSPRGRSVNPSIVSSRSTSPSKKYIKDPHASLDLFSPKATDENQQLTGPNAVPPRASAKPAPREMSELFAAGHEDHEPGSPKKAPVTSVPAPKGRSQQKFAPSRLFADDPDEPAAVPYKSNPAKYNHFDIGEVPDYDPMQYHESPPKPKPAVPFRGKSAKHGPQWEFQDFYTPAKVGQKVRDHDVVHFSLDNAGNNLETPVAKGAAKPRRDNETHFELRDDGTPVERIPVHKPRKDAETHFQFRDTDTPAPNRSGRPASSASDRQGLYTNNLYDEDENSQPQEKAPLATITNNKGRKHDFDSHWTMTDESPAAEKVNNENKHAGGDHAKAVKMMDSQWDNEDQITERVTAPGRQSHLKKGLESHWQMGGDQPASNNGKNGKTDKKSFWDF